jgi:glutaminyl-tRNA synthetase
MPRDFIRDIIDEDLRTNKWGGRVHTRFPPEPNGYLHIGHAKSICLNHGLAVEYGGEFNLRFDDTNPVKEEQEYVDSIIADVRWLGARWVGMRDDDPYAGVLFASDYFPQLYEWAEELVTKGLAYVCDLSPDEVREYRGTLTKPGRNSPYRERSAEENLDLLRRMRAGEFPDGSRTLRAKIDMAHPNLNMRDAVMYRILHAAHHRSGDKWCIYPSYDWAHGQEDSIEGITHSICTLEFENHRPLYDWFLNAINAERGPDSPYGLAVHKPQQTEFARLNLNYTVMSKRKLLELVKEQHVRGWDDPRMPTICGLRRRGYTPEAIREFCTRVGVAKFEGVSDVALLEHCAREHLNKVAPRVMAVLRPLKVVIENHPEGQVEELEAINNPEDPAAGTRKVPFSRELYIEQDDFREEPPPKYWRLFPGNEVRLRYAYFVTCTGVVKNERGEVVEVHCTYDPATRGGDSPDGRKVKSTLHWVSATHAFDAEVRLYDHLFTKADPDDVEEGQDYKANLNPSSLEALTGCKLEPPPPVRAPRLLLRRSG